MSRIVAIVPAHNESEAIADVVRDIYRSAPGVDVVVIDDASTDETAAIAESCGAWAVRLPVNLGIGGAVQTGFQFARERGYDVALQVDGDGQHPAEAIPRLVQPVLEGKADVTIASRFLTGEGFQSTGTRRIGIWMFRVMSRLVTGRTFTDCTSGFRAFNRDAIRFLAENYPSDYPEVEAIVILCHNGFTLEELPVAMRERQGGRSSINVTRSAYYMLKVTLASLISRWKPVRR